MQRRHLIQSAAALSLGSSLATHAQAVDQVKVLYGFPAGSAGDICARRVVEKFAGSSFTKNAGVVDNKPGAGGRIALELLKPTAPDGTTIAMTPYSALALYPHIYAKLPYNPFTDFTMLGTASMIHHGFCVGPKVPESVKNLRDFVAWAKANPKDASYGTPAAGSTPHFIGALLDLNTRTDLTAAHYRGSVPGITDVVGGQIAAMCCPHGDQIANHKAGKLRILATSGRTRSPFVPDVATFAEQGFNDLVVEEWFGFVGPAKMATTQVKAANEAINAALKDKGVQDALTVVGLIPFGGTTEAQSASLKAEHDRWGPLIKRIGFTAES